MRNKIYKKGKGTGREREGGKERRGRKDKGKKMGGKEIGKKMERIRGREGEREKDGKD